jgi:DNA-binding helix-hairpin-helix protein with protein kinase domain
MRMNYLTQAGQPVSLAGRLVGRGGEGQILPVAGAPRLVAKIFHKPTLERWWKVALLLANPLPQTATHPSVVWPSEVLFTNAPQPQFAGYTMPRVTAAHPIFNFYVMDIRRAKYPAFDYRYLVRCARNLAAAVALAHQHGHVIGDLNESNALGNLQGVVRLLDVDSWQVVDSARGIVYPCGVGKAEFMAPELQGRDLAHLVRKPCQDNFALSVLIFKLLNEGTHPFDAVYHGRGDPPPLEARIASGSFPYRDASGRWTPKPLAVPFGSLHPSLQQFFIQTFQTGHAQPEMRPTAWTWQQALAKSEQDFRVCTDNPYHWCWSRHCIWCERTARLGGLDPFPRPPRAKRRQAKPPSAPVQQQIPMPQYQASPAVSWQTDWLPAPLAEVVQAIAQQLALPPLLVEALAAGTTIVAAAVIVATLLRLLT